MADTSDVRIGERLEKARISLGLTLEEVARRAGFNSYQTLSYMEKGSRPVKVSELAQLSKIYSKDPMYFIQEKEPIEGTPVFAWRDRSAVADTKGMEARIHYLLTNYHLLEEISGEIHPQKLVPWDKPQWPLTFESVAERAQELVNELTQDYWSAVPLIKVLEEKLNVKVLHLEMGEAGSALCSYGDFGFAIIVNATDPPWRRNFDIAHELFHLFTINIYPLEDIEQGYENHTSHVEKLANSFGAALLMPEKPLLEELRKRTVNQGIAWVDLIRIAIEFEVSTQALLWRLVNLSKLEADMVTHVIESPEFESMNRQFRLEKNLPAREYSARFVWLGLKALLESKISKSKFCRIFNIRKTEFPTFIASWGYTEDLVNEPEVELNYT